MLQIVRNVQDALLNAKSSDAGYLIGYENGKDVVVLGFIIHGSSPSQDQEIESLLPSPLKIIGTFATTSSPAPPISNPRNILLEAHSTSPGLPPKYTMKKDGSDVSKPEILESKTLETTAVTLLRCALDFPLLLGQDMARSSDAIKEQLTSPNTTFLIANSSGTAMSYEYAPDQTVASLSKGRSWDKPLIIQPMVNASKTSGRGGNGLSAPLLDVSGDKRLVGWTSVHLDVLCYIPQSEQTITIHQAAVRYIVPSLLCQLETVIKQLVSSLAGDYHNNNNNNNNNNDMNRKKITPFRALHFKLPNFAHHITLIYPLSWPSSEEEEKALQSRRKYIHAVLGMPSDRPLVRSANSVDPGSLVGSSTTTTTTSATKRLQNVHKTLPPSGIQNGSLHTVMGDYDYFHYMQDKFDDCGWGCAYRSLQTICSWFHRQHYTHRIPPTHREIQTTLVSIGDKTQDFIGSKQWIGAIELGYILDSLLGVESKVITVSRGVDMPSKAREIAAHFDSQGTPIMIGGGVLAYTLLGIDYDLETGECAFLILDPHYTGSDEIGKIHSGQWVAWKRLGEKAAAGGELFVQDAFYNLLCPQRPRTV